MKSFVLQANEDDSFYNKTSQKCLIALISGTMKGPHIKIISARVTDSFPFTHLSLDRMAAISQMIFSDGVSWVKTLVFWLKVHLS